MKNYAKITSMKKSSGFTLIELIVTVSIAAILMSIAVPSFKTMIDSNRLSTGTNELVSAFILARSEALKRSQTVTVCTSTNSTTCASAGNNDFGQGWIVFVDCGTEGVKDASSDCNGDGDSTDVGIDDDPIINAHSGLKDLTIVSNSATPEHYLTYSFSGRPSGTVTLRVTQNGSVQKRIVIGRSGRIRTQ